MTETELYHYGILGQQWGVRRYQNIDGTRTAAGKARYNQVRDDYLDGKASKSQLQSAKKDLKRAVKLDTGKELAKADETPETMVGNLVLKRFGVHLAARFAGKAARALLDASAESIAMFTGGFYAFAVTGLILDTAILVKDVIETVRTAKDISAYNAYIDEKYKGEID